MAEFALAGLEQTLADPMSVYLIRATDHRGRVSLAEGEYHRAHDLLTVAADKMKENFGATHPNTFMPRFSLIQTQAELGNVKDAMAANQTLIDDAQRYLQEDHYLLQRFEEQRAELAVRLDPKADFSADRLASQNL